MIVPKGFPRYHMTGMARKRRQLESSLPNLRNFPAAKQQRTVEKACKSDSRTNIRERTQIQRQGSFVTERPTQQEGNPLICSEGSRVS